MPSWRLSERQELYIGGRQNFGLLFGFRALDTDYSNGSGDRRFDFDMRVSDRFALQLRPMRTRLTRTLIVAWLLGIVALGDNSAVGHADIRADHVVDMSSWSAGRIAAYRQRVKLDQKPEAILRIPSIRLVVPVFAGTSSAVLDQGAGHIEGTSPFGTSGNTGIAAHRDGFFRALRGVKVGDVLQVDLPEATLTYKVVSTRVIDPSETSVLRPTAEPTITLVTCYPFYFVGSAPQRFIVRAKHVPKAEEIRLSRARA